MSKRSAIFLLLTTVFPVLSLTAEEREFTISVHGEEQTVVIPEDMSAEEAFVEMAELYYEAEADLTDSLDREEALRQETDEYQGYVDDLINSYNDLLTQYRELSDVYERSRRPSPLLPYLGMSGGRSWGGEWPVYGGVEAGLAVYETTTVGLETSYAPFRLGLRATFRFD